MSQSAPRPALTAQAPQGFRDALPELVQIGMRVARMIGRVADAETALAEAAAADARVAEGVSGVASSLAEAIEADRAAAAAAESRHTVVARAEAVARAFSRVSRGIRLTILLAERLDRGWAQRGESDDRQAMARRQIARGVADAIAREADGERAAQLSGALAERLDAMDSEGGIGDRPADEIIAAICRDLGLDPVRMVVRPLLRNRAGVVKPGGAAPLTSDRWVWEARPPTPRPDG